MTHPLLNQLITPQDARLLAQELAAILKTQYRVPTANSNPLEEILRQEVRVSVAEEVRKIFAHSSDNGYRILLQLSQELQRLPLLEISLAYQPTWEQLQELHQWFVREFQTSLLLQTRYEPFMLAGIRLAWQGAFLDLSLHNDLVNTATRKWKVLHSSPTPLQNGIQPQFEQQHPS